MHTPTDMVSEATTVSTAAHPTPHFDFTWLILPARAAGDGRPLDGNKKSTHSQTTYRYPLPNHSQVPTPKPLTGTHSQTTHRYPLPNHSQVPTPKSLTGTHSQTTHRYPLRNHSQVPTPKPPTSTHSQTTHKYPLPNHSPTEYEM